MQHHRSKRSKGLFIGAFLGILLLAGLGVLAVYNPVPPTQKIEKTLPAERFLAPTSTNATP